MVNLLTANILSFENLKRITPPQNLQAGRHDFEQGLASVDQATPQSAWITVHDHRTGEPYRVTIWLHSGQIALSCTCRSASQWYPCRHRVAGFLALEGYLRQNPPQVWKAVLEQATQPRTRRPTGQRGPIVFSLQLNPTGWLLLPYTIAASHFGQIAIEDQHAVAEAIVQQHLTVQAKPLRSRITHQQHPNATPEAIVATNLIAGNPYNMYNYGYYGGREDHSTYEAALPFLKSCIVFLGEQNDPLQRPLRILEEPGRFALQLEKPTQGLRLVSRLIAGDQTITIEPGALRRLATDPTWVLINDLLLQLDEEQSIPETLLENPVVNIPAKDATEFLESYLLPIAERVPVESDLIEWEDVDLDPELRLYLSESVEGLRAELRFGYGEYELPFDKQMPSTTTQRKPGTMTLARVKRRTVAEGSAWQELPSFSMKRGTDPGVLLLRRNVQPIDFLLHQIPRLVEAGYTIFGEEALTSARVNRNKPTISFNVSSGIDWFDVQAVVNFGDLTVALKDIRQAVRKREKYVKLTDGSIGALPPEWIERYRHMLALGEETSGVLRFSNHHLTMLDQLLGEADRAQADPEFERRREKLRSFEKIEAQPLSTSFKGELRPYQKAGYDWLHFLRDYHFGGCLADDMGLGKTVSALALLDSVYATQPELPASLIVMPRSLLFNWEREAAKFAPQLSIYIHADQGRHEQAEEFSKYNLVLTTYGTMLRDIELLRSYTFHYAILDESQAIKNPLAETSKAARLLQCEHRLVLTGTPVENSTTELWSQFAFLNPGLLGNLEYFRQEFASPIERQQNGETAQFLRKMVHPFILRRTKDQVAPDLPPRSEEVLTCDMEPAQRKLYNKQRDYYRSLLLGLIESDGMNDARMKILEGLLRLRQICNHPRLVDDSFKGSSGKFELLLDTLNTIRAEGHRALVFSQFVSMLGLVREALDANNVPYAYLDGQTRKRKEIVDRFQMEDDLPFFLISLKAGGVGLNLTAADYVIHIDPWWNPAVEMQATDRTHRIGQDKPVFVYRLVARDSVEEKILQLQEHKRALVEQVIGVEGGVFKSLTREDIEVLFT